MRYCRLPPLSNASLCLCLPDAASSWGRRVLDAHFTGFDKDADDFTAGFDSRRFAPLEASTSLRFAPESVRCRLDTGLRFLGRLPPGPSADAALCLLYY